MPVLQATQSLATKAKLFRGFSDPSRLTIIEALRQGALNVTEVMGLTGLTQSNVSNHLACLLDCGLVGREQRGRFSYYRLSDDRVDELLMLADVIVSEVASGVDCCANYARPAKRGTNRSGR